MSPCLSPWIIEELNNILSHPTTSTYHNADLRVHACQGFGALAGPKRVVARADANNWSYPTCCPAFRRSLGWNGTIGPRSQCLSQNDDYGILRHTLHIRLAMVSLGKHCNRRSRIVGILCNTVVLLGEHFISSARNVRAFECAHSLKSLSERCISQMLSVLAYPLMMLRW